jgi:glycosyltransferase involved in cell wall biosynthesis
MKVLVTDNAHLYKTPDGKYYTPSIYNYDFFQRYLNVFDEVRFVSKTKYVDSIDKSKFLLVSREGLEIYELPWYQGVKGMFKKIFKLIQKYRRACDGCDCYIFRVAQIESYLTYIFANRRNKPYAVEVVNNPAEFSDMNNMFKWINVNLLKMMIRRANGVAYVTQSYLQRLYPSRASIKGESEKYFESSYSSIELSENDICKPKKYPKEMKCLNITHISNFIKGNMKGHKTLIDIINIITKKGYDVKVEFIGDGPSVVDFERYADSLNIGERVNFIGKLHTKTAVMNELVNHDLFVFPSFYEGLPRVVLEAQAAGLPCLSTRVGGIPELLKEKYLHKPGDSESFANSIMRLINKSQELEKMSIENIENAKKYTQRKLREKRGFFYCRLRSLAEKEGGK